MNGEPDLIPFNFVGRNLHVREETVAPVAFTRLRDFITRHGDNLLLHQAGEADEHVVFVVLRSFYLDVGNLILLGCTRVEDNRLLLFSGRQILRLRGEAD